MLPFTVQPFIPVGTAQGNNRVNNSTVLPTGQVAQQQVQWVGSIGAGTTIPISLQGTEFYVIASNGTVYIRPNPGGTFNEYFQGTGQSMAPGSAFTMLEVQNQNTFPVAILIVVGFGSFIDKRLIIDQNTNPNICVATYSVPQTSPILRIPDLSGQLITSVQGTKYYALNRVQLTVSNVDTTTPIYIQGYTSDSALTNNVGGVLNVPPQQDIVLAASGAFGLTLNKSTNVNCLVSEIYQGIPDIA
jgi:hypothetical protein